MNLDHLWKEALKQLESRSNRATFELFIKSIQPVAVSEGVLYVSVPNSLSLEYLEEFRPAIEEIVLSIHGASLKLVADQEKQEKDLPQRRRETGGFEGGGVSGQANAVSMRPAAVETEEAGPVAPRHRELNSKYIFESFVVGNTNRMCYAAAKAVAEGPGRAYNPLFLYGGVGLGKTHLMHAIGHSVHATKPNLKVLYATTDAMYHQMTQMIQENRLGDFQKHYQKADVLLVDDIQFLQGKDRTQLEFFHVFNSLHNAGKQIVITCDRLPKEIPNLEDRLVSRLNWGLIADIKPPDFETRVAILSNKMRDRNRTISKEVLEYIASLVTSNIRDLEGALTKIVAFSDLSSRPVTVELVDEVAQDLVTKRRSAAPTIDDIIQKTAEHFNVNPADLKGKRRNKEIAFPRQICIHLCRELTRHSLAEIGRAFSDRDHSSILYTCDKIDAMVKSGDEAANRRLEEIKTTLGIGNLFKS